MEYAVIQMIADWLGRGDLHRENGFNDLRASFAQEVTHPIRDVGYIGDETRDDIVASRRDAPTTRALYIMAAGPSTVEELNPNQNLRDSKDVTIAIQYIVTNPDSSEAIAESYLSVRTILRSLGRLLKNEYAASRTKYSVDILGVSSTVAGPIREAIGDASTATAAVLVAFSCRDRDVA